MSTADEFGNKKKLSVIENSPTDYEVGKAEKKSNSYALDKPCNLTELQGNKCESSELQFDVLSGVGFAVQAFNFAYEKDDSMLQFAIKMYPIIPDNPNFRHYDENYNATQLLENIENAKKSNR